MSISQSSYGVSKKDTVAKDKVIAVVNNQVITTQDLGSRFQLTLRYLKVNLTKPQQEELYRKTLGVLINEQIQRQFAESLRLTVSPEELKRGIAIVERNNSIPNGSFYKIIHGLEGTAVKQVENEILWQKVIGKKVRPKVNISNSEVDKLIENLLSKANISEKELSQIFIASEDGKTSEAEKQVKSIYKRLKQGESFSKIAKTLSDDQTASQGGYLGWFAPSELSPILEAETKKLEKIGSFTQPVQTSTGWHILKVDNIREIEKFSAKPYQELRIMRLAVELPSLENIEDKKELKEIQKKITKLQKEFNKNIKKIEHPSDFEGIILAMSTREEYKNSKDMGWIKEKELPEEYLTILTETSAGEISDIIKNPTSWEVIYQAAKREKLPEKLQEYRKRVRIRVVENRVSLMARRFMRDLRRKAYIDIHLDE